MKSTLQVLTEARALIAKPENWCQRERRRSDGARCALGALDGVFGVDGNYTAMIDVEKTPAALALGEAAIAMGESTPAYYSVLDEAARLAAVVANFNNNRTHAEVLAMFDRVIEAERAKEHGSRLDAQVQTIIDDALTVAADLPKQVAVTSTT